MEKLGIAFGAGSIGLVLGLFLPIISAAFGWVAGWMVEWAFVETTDKFLVLLGMPDFSLAEVGAALAFFAAFFKPTQVSK